MSNEHELTAADYNATVLRWTAAAGMLAIGGVVACFAWRRWYESNDAMFFGLVFGSIAVVGVGFAIGSARAMSRKVKAGRYCPKCGEAR